VSEQRRHSLLVVDDEPGVVESVYELFRIDYDVSKALCAEDALHIMEDRDIHVLMADQRMPGVSGVELLKLAKEGHPDTVRLLFTGYADIHVVVEAINEGSVFRYIVKPWDTDEIKATVRQAAEHYDLVAERKELVEKLQTANELKKNFIAIASHELNTPTFIVAGMAKLASKMAKSDAHEAAACLEAINYASGRLEAIVTKMLRLVSLENFTLAAPLERVSIGEMIEELKKELGPFLDVRHIALDVQADPALELNVNRDLMEDVLEILVSNAIRFSPDGSTITITAHAQDGWVKLRVVDTGMGISQEDLPHVFEPFFTSKDILHHHSGTYEYGSRGIGLGLTVARKFVDIHRGTIRIDSSKDRGTTVTVMLPQQTPQPARREAAAAR